MTTYEYKPLSDRCIRLLSLKFDANSDPLKLSISIHSIDEPLAYTALSYVWGDAFNRIDIIVLDEDRNEQTVSVTTNLHAALWRLRFGGCDSYIWADAICMNQGDNEEKSRQVRMMTEIYSRSNSVFGWLGEGRPGDNDVTKTIEYLLSPNTYPSWAALWEILVLPWFRRVWIIQEIVVS
ncbi:heterokaryon incompatibility protein-domain-containing protein, partial [Pyrenochaeta sp. MPI-SDFR-AT-0127]